jgi:pimeloyl-ACP methyl ester carboxylesterase
MKASDERIEPEFATVDGLEIRYARSAGPAAETLVLLSPWPESIYAFAPMWSDLAAHFSLVAIDLPGFGRSQGRSDLMSTRAMGEFVVRLIAELGAGTPHAVGPDVGTAALLWAAVDHPDAFRSVVVGAGAATFPLHVDGLLKTFVDAGDIGPFKELDPAEVIRQFVEGFKSYAVPDLVKDDYTASYAGARFAESISYVQSYPRDLEALAPHLPTLRMPVQIIVGRDDPYGLAIDAERLHAILPDSKLDVFPCGHNAWEEDAAGYAGVIVDWVSQRGLTSS